MKIEKAVMFNRLAANPENKPEEILKALHLRQGQVVADIRAGGGLFFQNGRTSGRNRPSLRRRN
ncbi:MAG TPA: hypothetical protein ENL38_00720 [Candidatus Aminicenantes bacterium]|nr:hypothetical protein [Candidatus Aminicenantes bacterium]